METGSRSNRSAGSGYINKHKTKRGETDIKSRRVSRVKQQRELTALSGFMHGRETIEDKRHREGMLVCSGMTSAAANTPLEG